MAYQAGVRYVERKPDEEALEKAAAQKSRMLMLLKRWHDNPVHFTCEALHAQPDPWQCDVMDALVENEDVAIRACHGVGKTALLAWVINWFTPTRPYAKVPTTAPTFNKQVRDVLWSEVHKWWRIGLQNSDAAWLLGQFELTQTRMYAKEAPEEWFAVGIASSNPLNIEGYHSPHILIIFDEAKGIQRTVWESVQGMRTTQEGKFLVASTPGGPVGEFYKVFTQYRSTWKSLFSIHPIQLKPTLKRTESAPYSMRGTYYSTRVRDWLIQKAAAEWGVDSPAYIARIIGDFPSIEGDVLIPYSWLSDAEDIEQGIPGPRIVSCDVARYGRDRTVIIAGEGGTPLYGETIARTPAESASPDAVLDEDETPETKQPRFRSTVSTAEACIRIRRQWECEAIVIDDTGIGGGVTDILRKKGEVVIPINFGARPTDRPKDAEERARRDRKHLVDTKYRNIKAEMGWALRNAFEGQGLALGALTSTDAAATQALRDTLIAQCSMVKYQLNEAGVMWLIDPDDQDTIAVAAGELEGRKSPDHFHALLLYWWVAGRVAGTLVPKAGQPIPSTIKRLGSSANRQQQMAGQTSHIRAGRVAGQAAFVRARYRG